MGLVAYEIREDFEPIFVFGAMGNIWKSILPWRKNQNWSKDLEFHADKPIIQVYMTKRIKKAKHHKELTRLYNEFEKASKEMAGYPASLIFDYSVIHPFLKFHINNIGDPFAKPGHYRINTLQIEKNVIDRFAKLFHAPKNSYWGYVTNGGTEGNLYGLLVARELYPEGVVFYSDQTHYSVPKCLRLLKMPSRKIPSLPNGEIDYHELQSSLNSCKTPPIIFANIGTTMKGAVDNVGKIKEILHDLKLKDYYIHCDAAFFGLILPFIPEIEKEAFDFRIGIDSIAISGHKMIGTPFPCGVVLTKKNHIAKMGSFVEYTGVPDNTITGSRNGLAPLFLWQELIEAEKGKLEKIVNNCIETASYTIKKFSNYGIKAWRNKNSVIVVFPRPTQKTILKWQLAVQGDIAHIITLSHLTHKQIDTLVKEIAKDLKKREYFHTEI